MAPRSISRERYATLASGIEFNVRDSTTIRITTVISNQQNMGFKSRQLSLLNNYTTQNNASHLDMPVPTLDTWWLETSSVLWRVTFPNAWVEGKFRVRRKIYEAMDTTCQQEMYWLVGWIFIMVWNLSSWNWLGSLIRLQCL